jgi:hypothetical protein
MPSREEQIKADYKKYLRNIAENYSYGEKGFPPDVNPDRLLELDEYTEWWKEREVRINKLAEEIMHSTSRAERAEALERYRNNK